MGNSKNGNSNGSPKRFVGRIAKAVRDSERSIEKAANLFEKALPEAAVKIGKQLIRPTAGQMDAAAKIIEAYAAVYSQMAKTCEDFVGLLGEVEEVVRKHRDRQKAYTLESFQEKDVEKAAKTAYAAEA